MIGLRAELIRRDMQLAYLERRAGVDDADGALQQAHDRDMAALDDDLEFLRRINVGGVFIGSASAAGATATAKRTPF
ncbi:MAG: hypothetical protein AB2814_04220 [Candidatus Sedimenticola endophacoides]